MATATATTGERLLTIDEYLKLPDDGVPTELVRGRIITLSVPFAFHGVVCAAVVELLRAFVRQRDFGYVMSNDSGIITERDPDSLRGADVAFYSYARVPKGTLPKRGFPNAAPDLVVEVRSPGDPWGRLLEKVAEYLAAEVRAVVVLDIQRSTATVYRGEEPEVTLQPEQSLELPDILPGFSVVVKQFFE